MNKQLESLIADWKFYAGEAQCHPDPNYCLEFEKLSTPGNVLALIAALEQAQQSEEVAELLRDKVKRLESDIWDSQQLVRVKSENQYELECKVRELEERNDKSNTAWSRREDAALEKLEATKKRIAELEASPLAVRLPPHKYRECVNGLLEEAIAYAGTQQLRSRLSARLSNFVKPGHAAGGTVEGE